MPIYAGRRSAPWSARWTRRQRHLKASGIFARLWHRDGKRGYLGDVPRTLRYIVEAAAPYPELAPLQQLVQGTVLPRLEAD